MKQKKGDWLTKNSTLLFIIFISLSILLANYSFVKFRDLRIFFDWGTFLTMILSVIFFLLLVFFMVFIIYYEDALHNRNKRTFRLYEEIINRFFPKGESK